MEPSFQHKQFIAGNIRVFFPFEPYETQRKYATDIVDTLNGAKNAILESPTGTGKTLSLLCSTLAWLQSQNGTVKSIVYYTSRTHVQLAQAAKELKRTAYAKIPSVVIGSRAQMCLNHDVRHQGGDHLINRACRNAIAKNSCIYHSNYEQKLEKIDSDKVLDIEDLMDVGNTSQLCPYYASKKLAESKSTVIFMPYNYLLDPSLKKGDQLKLDNSIIIFDEAHNIESVLKDAVSGEFTQACLKSVIDSCSKLPEKVSEALNYESHGLSRYGYDPSKRANKDGGEGGKSRKSKKNDPNEPEKVNPIEELATKLTVEKLQQVSRCSESLLREIPKLCDMSKTLTIETLLDLFKSTGIHYATSDQLTTTLESMSSFWSIAGVMNPAVVQKSVHSISNLWNFITLIFPERCVNQSRLNAHEVILKQNYISYLDAQFEDSNVFKKGNKLKDWQLNLWCLHPSIGMNRVVNDNCVTGPRSLIITSGTLAPLSNIEKELGQTFEIKREFDHIIGPNQLKIFTLFNSPSDYSLKSSYEETKKDKYKLELGKTLLPLFRVLPFGTLVFFPSYSLLDKVIKYWKEKCEIWRDMLSSSTLFIESKTQDDFLNDVNNFKRRINEKRRAVFFCVCRGKLSEGVNLEGDHCRTVILTGLPFPSVNDPRVRETRLFNEKRNDRHWYVRQMTRALNQTVGRIIRNKSDFGLLILCDPRFKDYKYQLSEWTKPFYPDVPTKFEDLQSQLKEFFEGHGIDIRETVSENHGAFEISLSRNKTTTATVAKQTTAPLLQPQQHVNTNSQRAESIRDRVAEFVAPLVEEHRRLQSSQRSIDLITIEEDEPVGVVTSTPLDQLFDSSFDDIELHPIEPKRSAPSSNNIFKKKPKTNHASSNAPDNVPEVITITTSNSNQNSNSDISTNRNKNTQTISQNDLNYSILKQNIPNKNTRKVYTCYICKNEAVEPKSTNCPCARLGCFRCLKVLNNTNCGTCQTLLKKKFYKPMKFHANKYST